MQAHLKFLRRKLAHRAGSWLNRVSSIANTPLSANVVLTTTRHELAETQLYPFHFYRDVLAQKHGLRYTQIEVESLVGPEAGHLHGTEQHKQVKRVFFQPAFEMPPEQAVQALQRLAHAYPNAKIAYLDWYAPLHIRPALYADPYIDIYVKKQTYANFAEYSKPTLGDTNLNDYYAKRHGLPDAPQQFTLPPGFEHKLRLGSNFGLSALMVDWFLGASPTQSNRDIDLHARIAVNGVPWYQVMRQEAKDAVQKLSNLNIASEGRVRRHQFFAEMVRSKLCFSPFGYGEVCWRDYEAHATGALLLKPDMSHLRVLPDIFVPYETYVPLQWDLSDFADKVAEYLQDHTARAKITAQAFEVNSAWIKSREYAATIAAWCS
ncbi:hypothetical protein [Rhodoferax saidenbachensis]|uniref:Glycosyltransferase family 1 protein n=1 Tax=Rhodoferax saidenbachensis TaxID=1484693 RepID=A0ABU1ZJ96_9BURK|nr:hypothetical protein [Rhodoferax saidenbachensis]MDR7305625.1 hypothetical protein [Rhodoferax saidenbachensis]